MAFAAKGFRPGTDVCKECIKKFPHLKPPSKNQILTLPPLAGTDMSAYRERKLNLEAIGFASYKDYLKSDLWAEIRKRVYKAKKMRCSVCKKKSGKQLHHCSYAIPVLKGEDIGPLWPICRTCHKRVEHGPDGHKLSMADTNARFLKAMELGLAFLKPQDARQGTIEPKDDQNPVLTGDGQQR